jgi:hypothetical protein
VLSTVDKSNAEEGILTLRVSYTGTTKEADEAREDALHNELQVLVFWVTYRPCKPTPHTVPHLHSACGPSCRPTLLCHQCSALVRAWCAACWMWFVARPAKALLGGWKACVVPGGTQIVH